MERADELAPIGIALPAVWQVCFCSTERRFWWNRFLTRGFEHVYLLGYLPEYGAWMYFDPQADRLLLAIVSKEIAGRLLTRAYQGGRILTYEPEDDTPQSVLDHFGTWCVPAVRHVLGVRCVAVTPKGLHDFLLENGARPFIYELQHQSPAGRPGDQSAEGSPAEAG